MIKHGKADKQAARSARLSAALRENLKRRKAQARSRAADGLEDEAAPAETHPAAAASPDFRRNPGTKSGQGSGGPAAGSGG